MNRYQKLFLNLEKEIRKYMSVNTPKNSEVHVETWAGNADVTLLITDK